MSTSPVLRIHLFGALRLYWREVELPPFPTAKGASLFAYLAYHGDRSHKRSKLAGLLWPELPEQTARRRLSQELWRIRRFLSHHVGRPLVEGNTQIGLGAGVQWEVDVHAFLRETEDGADQETLARAVERYTGDLLAELDDEWIFPLREQLRQRHLAALTALVEMAGQAGQWERALEYARRLVQAEPLAERGHRLVMQAYMHLGKPHLALAQFDELTRLLQEELDASPTPATLQLAEHIREEIGLSERTGTAPFLEAPSQLPMVGRDLERARLVEALEWTLGGNGGVVLIEGEAGVGKTKLLDVLAEDAIWRGAQVYRAAAGEVEEQTLGPLIRAVDPFLTVLHVQQLALILEPLWLGVLADFFPQFSEALDNLPRPPALAPDAARQRDMEAFWHLLRAMGQIGPAAILLDDLHRADLETWETLRLLTRGLRSVPVLVVAAYRGEAIRLDPERWRSLQAVDQAGVRRRLLLRPLEERTIGELVCLALGMGRVPGQFAARIHAQTGGNPFFVLESLRSLYESGLLYQTDQGEWATPWDTTQQAYAELVLPERVEELLEQRLRRLSQEERALVAAAAVLGSEFTLPALQAVSPLAPLETFQALRQLVSQGFLVETDTHLRFRHDLMREVVYQNLPMHRARELHSRIGRILADQDQAPSPVLAHHFTLAQDWPQALHHHRRASQEALAHSDYRRARHHVEEALAALAHLPEEEATRRIELLLDHEHIVDILGDLDAQAQDLAQLAELAAQDAGLRGEVLCRTAGYHIRRSRYGEARLAAEQALALARRLGDVDLQVRALTLVAQIESYQGALAQAISLLQQAVTLEPREETRQAEAFLALANALSSMAQYREARGAAEAAMDRFAGLGFKHRQVDALNVLGIVAMEEGLYDQAEKHHRQGIALSREIGYRFGEVRARVNLANIFNKTGQLGACIQLYEEVLAMVPALGLDRVEAITRINLASTLVAFVGDTERARELLSWVIQYARQVEDPVNLGHALANLTAADLLDERWEEARCHMDEAKEVLEEAGELFVLAQFQRTCALWHIKQGDLESGFREAEAGLALCRTHGMAALEPWMLSMMGWIRAQQGRAEEALALTQAAMDALGNLDEMDYMMWYYRAVALEAAGHLQEARHALAQAVERLEATLATLSPEHQALSRRRVAEHRAILAAWAERQPRQSTVILPAHHGSGARAVRWTVHAPEDEDIPDDLTRRRHRLRRLLDEAASQGARPTVQALAQALGVSRRTVRRDLAALEGMPKTSPAAD